MHLVLGSRSEQGGAVGPRRSESLSKNETVISEKAGEIIGFTRHKILNYVRYSVYISSYNSVPSLLLPFSEIVVLFVIARRRATASNSRGVTDVE